MKAGARRLSAVALAAVGTWLTLLACDKRDVPPGDPCEDSGDCVQGQCIEIEGLGTTRAKLCSVECSPVPGTKPPCADGFECVPIEKHLRSTDRSGKEHETVLKLGGLLGACYPDRLLDDDIRRQLLEARQALGRDLILR